MDGTITVESTMGKGSCFSIDLPHVAGPLAGLASADTASTLSLAISGPPRTVLYIEDNISNLTLIQRILDRQPEIRLVASLQGRLGLDLAREHQPDLILLDLHLPDLSGEQVLQCLQADPATRSIPVVVLSADATAHTIERLYAAGVRNYLTKPLDVPRFLQLLQEVLAA
jgi:CheY-like chemotaxis protein